MSLKMPLTQYIHLDLHNRPQRHCLKSPSRRETSQRVASSTLLASAHTRCPGPASLSQGHLFPGVLTPGTWFSPQLEAAETITSHQATLWLPFQRDHPCLRTRKIHSSLYTLASATFRHSVTELHQPYPFPAQALPRLQLPRAPQLTQVYRRPRSLLSTAR